MEPATLSNPLARRSFSGRHLPLRAERGERGLGRGADHEMYTFRGGPRDASKPKRTKGRLVDSVRVNDTHANARGAGSELTDVVRAAKRGK